MTKRISVPLFRDADRPTGKSRVLMDLITNPNKKNDTLGLAISFLRVYNDTILFFAKTEEQMKRRTSIFDPHPYIVKYTP